MQGYEQHTNYVCMHNYRMFHKTAQLDFLKNDKEIVKAGIQYANNVSIHFKYIFY